jgi:hypothetical protein
MKTRSFELEQCQEQVSLGEKNNKEGRRKNN